MNDKIYRNTKKSKSGELSLKIKPHISEEIDLICRVRNVEKTTWCNTALEKAVKDELERIRRIVNE